MILHTCNKLCGWFGIGFVLLVGLTSGCANNKPAAQKASAFWPPYPDEPRIQFLTSYKSSDDVAPRKSKLDELVLGKEVQQVLGLAKPYGVAMYQGKIYVCDLRSQAVTVLDIRNHRTLIMGRTGADTLQHPTDIAVAPDGFKYVTDQDKGLVFAFDSQDRMVGRFGHKDFVPVGIAVYQDELYVIDFKARHVEVLNRQSGQVLRTIGESGPGDGQFMFPIGISIDDQGYVYVTDVLKCQMQKFDRQGKLLTSFGTVSASAGGMVRPKHIAVDKDGTIYIVDAAFQNVQLFNQQGHVYTFFGSPGVHPGNMNLPVGIAIDDGDLDLYQSYIDPAFEAKRLIVVTNQFGDNKVAVYALGHLKAGKTVADIAASQGLVPSGTVDAKSGGRTGGPPPPSTTQAPDDTATGK